jgi:hypothetical protein
MKMKRMICTLLAAVLLLSLAACSSGNVNSGKQTASAYLDQESDAAIEVTVDLSGGWSVEFVRGAVYLYDSEITETNDGVAMLVTLDKEVYEEDLEAAMADESHKEADGGVYYTHYEDEMGYLTSLNDSAYVLITANKADIEAIVARFTLSLAN